ncbi:uncharacterized protein LACBIDRAFT_318761 [Laccaria bicolor S238N-H82]|uniref:Predicted protein n=1 Tax=Laccaria bicolor (strain S238N-H82 / ATCC MYA-4686) TaxID=486041 RepID=B0D711_LACBS|nr:uncharacterized protein LACBIDRAFT_318761 [Laccaria bicolor S238N-H82]EDR09571.1 predicted protein [Laccaria bicolor S238N-H82]|eukprot:XP_001879920.1 predicted protein [Laccaria bicolor S238N-H82]
MLRNLQTETSLKRYLSSRLRTRLPTSPTFTTSPTAASISRKHETTRSDDTLPSPLRHKIASASVNDLPTTSEAWHLEPNSHGKGGLKNTLDSRGD